MTETDSPEAKWAHPYRNRERPEFQIDNPSKEAGSRDADGISVFVRGRGRSDRFGLSAANKGARLWDTTFFVRCQGCYGRSA